MSASEILASSQIKEELDTRSINNRRLDQLAWLLEGSSECAAVCVINDKFCISANEFNDGTTNANQKMVHVLDVMRYFSAIAIGGQINEALRNQLIKSIFENQLIVMGKGALRIHGAEKWILDAVISSDVLSKYAFDNLASSNPETFKKLKDHSETAGLVLGRSAKIFRRIRKIENSIEKAKRGDFTEISEAHLNAFRNFSHNIGSRNNASIHSDILFVQREKKKKEPKEKNDGEKKEKGPKEKAEVHAEMQILDKIVNMVEANEIKDKEVYIGISKLCCFNCHHMLSASSSELKVRSLVLGFRGAHDGGFEWRLPAGFIRGGIGATEVDEDEEAHSSSLTSIAKRVNQGQLRAQIMDKYGNELQKNTASEEYNQRGGPSNSEPSESPADKFESYRRKLESDAVVLRERCGDEVATVIDNLEFGIKLCKDANSFKYLFVGGVALSLVAEDAFGRIISEVEAEKQSLFDFLINPKFTTPTIAECFAALAEELKVNVTLASVVATNKLGV